MADQQSSVLNKVKQFEQLRNQSCPRDREIVKLPEPAGKRPLNHPKPVNEKFDEPSSPAPSQMSTLASGYSGSSVPVQDSPAPCQHLSFNDTKTQGVDCISKEPPPLPQRNKIFCKSESMVSLRSKKNVNYTEDENIYEEIEVCRVRSTLKNCITLTNEDGNQWWEDEPIYQFYLKNDVLPRMIQQNMNDRSSQDDNADEEYQILKPMVLANLKCKFPSCFTLVEPAPKGHGHRKLWGELPEVIESGILERISKRERREQEAMFEVLTSEASFVRSLMIYNNVFARSSFFDAKSDDYVLNLPHDYKVLFQRMKAVQEVSQKLMADLSKKWHKDLRVTDICDVILEYTDNKRFEPYVTSSKHQPEQHETFNRLLQKPKFNEALQTLERNPLCQGLSMRSFLTLPMQRITRYHMLMDAILKQRYEDTPGYKICQKALAALKKVAENCNKATAEMSDLYRMTEIWCKIDWSVISNIPSSNKSRKFVKEGELSLLVLPNKQTMKAKPSKSPVWLFLFSDMLVICKKAGNKKNLYNPIDYCLRGEVEIDQDNLLPCLTLHPDKKLTYFKITFLENMQHLTVDYCFQEKTQNEAVRWIDAICPPIENSVSEKIYNDFDCPQVQAIDHYTASGLEELSLQPGEIISVIKMVEDGWYYGIRLHDGAKGWFPSAFTFKIYSRHVKSRNLHMRLRMIEAAESVWKVDSSS